jgi:3-carboxy-cis,cis-muconate cycloisomerase
MRPSSSPSDDARHTPGGTGEVAGLFDEVLARGRVRAAVSDHAWLAAMLDAEAALARAQASLGLISDRAATTIAGCAVPQRYDIAALSTAAAGPGNPVLPLVRALRAQVPPEVADAVHAGATSQDIMDTATMLVAHRALGNLLDDLAGATAEAARLARVHRDTRMAGRTLLQQALPVTFGLKAAGWLTALQDSADGLIRIRARRLAVQLGGGAGTLDAWGGTGLRLVERFAAELDLTAPTLPWHTDRTRIAELAGALATAAGAVGKVARDITLLAQSEVGEVTESAPGDSSAMAHKRNPVAAVAALAAAVQAPGLAATLYSAQVHEHERAAGAWHAEWRPLRELLISTGSATAWLRQCLSGLVVNEAALATNLERLVAAAALPDTTPGAAGSLVDRALAAYRHRESHHGGPEQDGRDE